MAAAGKCLGVVDRGALPPPSRTWRSIAQAQAGRTTGMVLSLHGQGQSSPATTRMSEQCGRGRRGSAEMSIRPQHMPAGDIHGGRSTHLQTCCQGEEGMENSSMCCATQIAAAGGVPAALKCQPAQQQALHSSRQRSHNEVPFRQQCKGKACCLLQLAQATRRSNKLVAKLPSAAKARA